MAQQQHADEWLMRDVAQGRRDSLEILVRRYAGSLLTFLRRTSGNADLAEELFQEVFLAVWKSRIQYDFPRPFRPWLFQIAVNKSRELHRNRGTWPATAHLEAGEVVDPSSATDPGDLIVAAETASLVTEAVARLPAQQRAVLVMRVWNEHDFDEIADAVRCTPSTARSHMHHALSALRKYLEPRMR